MKTLEEDLTKYEKEANTELFIDEKINSQLKEKLKNINILKLINNLETQLKYIEKLEH